MKRRNFLAGLALAPLAAQAGPAEADRFAAIHADLFRRWRTVDAADECGKTYCGKTLQQARARMSGNCLDYGMVLIDECARAGITGVSAAWCRANGAAHLVVLHAPSGLVADNQLSEPRAIGRRHDLTDVRVLWTMPGAGVSWDGQAGRTW